MADMTYSIKIQAPKEIVWEIMLGPETYKQWTGVFNPGSYYEGSWDMGSEIRFVSSSDGGKSGIQGRIIDTKPYETVTVEVSGEIIDGAVVTDGEGADDWIGSLERYRFEQDDDVTTLTVTLSGPGLNEEIKQMFDGMWPVGLAKLKEMAEA